MPPHRPALRLLAAAALSLACLSAWSDEAAIRKNFAERNPKAPPIDEVLKTPIAGLFEVRIGTEILYVDDQANYAILPAHDSTEGHIIETKSHVDLTEVRFNRLTQLDVQNIPVKDAIVRKMGNGSRKLVVFEDPNCHYCKDVEKNLVALKDVTIYTFLIPILGPDSVTKSREIWCAKDSAASWRSWMLAGTEPQRAMGQCDVKTLDRNLVLASRYRVNGTPALIFEDGSRFSGAVDLERLQKKLDEVAAATPATPPVPAKKG